MWCIDGQDSFVKLPVAALCVFRAGTVGLAGRITVPERPQGCFALNDNVLSSFHYDVRSMIASLGSEVNSSPPFLLRKKRCQSFKLGPSQALEPFWLEARFVQFRTEDGLGIEIFTVYAVFSNDSILEIYLAFEQGV